MAISKKAAGKAANPSARIVEPDAPNDPATSGRPEDLDNSRIVADQTQAIAELREAVASLVQSVQDSQVRKSQTDSLRANIDDVKAEVRQARTMLASNGAAVPAEQRGGCDDCGECGCVSEDCCMFEIVLDKVRATQPQAEPADMGEIGPFWNELEVRIFASVDGIGIVLPSLSTTMALRVPSFLAGGGPGLWMPINRVIQRVSVKKGTTLAVTVDFQASECDDGLERVVGWKDEHGEASGTVMVDCCVAKAYPPMPTDLSFDHGGTGGGIPGAISLAFYARRICC
jgi:hypothetical protein